MSLSDKPSDESWSFSFILRESSSLPRSDFSVGSVMQLNKLNGSGLVEKLLRKEAVLTAAQRPCEMKMSQLWASPRR